jgi:hypothetical protein
LLGSARWRVAESWLGLPFDRGGHPERDLPSRWVEEFDQVKERNWRIDIDEENWNCWQISERYKLHEEYAFVSMSEERIWIEQWSNKMILIREFLRALSKKDPGFSQ